MSVRRRGNGLTAESYVLLLDVDPRLADPLLAALATAGVAAYTTPATGRSGPFLELHPPTRPLESVHVDSTRRPEARRVLEETMPDVTVGMPSVEEEDSFAALVAGWDDEPDDHPWPAVEDVGLPPRPSAGSTDLAGGPPRRRRTDVLPAGPTPPSDSTASAEPTSSAAPSAEAGSRSTDASTEKPSLEKPSLEEPSLAKPSLEKPSLEKSSGSDPADAVGPAEPRAGKPDDGADDDLTDHYVPPHLPPLPPAHPVTKWGLVALGLGLVLLIFPTLLGLEHTTAVDVVGVLSILGGVGLLVSRLSGRSTDDYEGPDDGAVV